MGKKLYSQDEKGIRFVSNRRPGEVRIPNYVFDLWLPLLGADYIGVYSVYCRLERETNVTGMSNQKVARACRIGTSKLGQINCDLEELGFIKTAKPNGRQKLKHFTTVITVCDPPKTVTAENIAKYGNPETYEPLSLWLTEDLTNSQMGFNHSSQFPNGNADVPKQEGGQSQIGTPSLQPSYDLQPSSVELNTSNHAAPSGAGTELDTKPNPVEKLPIVTEGKHTPEVNKEINLIIKAWVDNSRITLNPNTNFYAIPTYRTNAGEMASKGVTGEMAVKWFDMLKQDNWWKSRGITWKKTVTDLYAWCVGNGHIKANPLPPSVSLVSPTDYTDYDDEPVITPLKIAPPTHAAPTVAAKYAKWWEVAHKQLEVQLTVNGNSMYHNYISHAYLASVEGNVWSISVPTQAVANMLTGGLQREIARVLRDVTGRAAIELTFAVAAVASEREAA